MSVSPFLRAKHHWYGDDAGAALACLEEIVGAGALYVPDDVLAARTGLSFEALVTGLLADDGHLMVPFDTVIGRLWAAFPGRYALDALELRGWPQADWLAAAARDGLLSRDPADHGLVGRVVVPETFPAPVAAAHGDGAWAREHPELTASLFLDAVFYPARVVDAAMVLDRLDRIAERQPELLELVAGALASWVADDVVRVGMRRDDGTPACRERLVDALRRLDFDALGDCLPGE